MHTQKKIFNSKRLIILIGILWLSLFFINKPWQRNLIVNDVVSYYSYLPATFIYHDLTLKFSEKDAFFADKFWPHTAPNGNKVIKMSMGLSIMYAPFFFLAHLIAPLFDCPRDGYSLPYQVCLSLSCLFYLLLGLFYLRKILILYFTEGVVMLTIISVYLGSNLFWYSTTSDGLMSHGYLFSILCVFIYQVISWHRVPALKHAILTGLTGGLLTLIRPTMILCFLFFILFEVYNKETFIAKIRLFKKHIPHLLLVVVFSFLILFPQLCYWKYTTGQWFFYSYIGEKFYFQQPHLIEGLFGFRKGWLLYTPIMAFAVIGLICLWRKMQFIFLAVSAPFLISIYVIFSWWCWWYGGSFGQRPMVDFYGMLALPMACFYQQIFTQVKLVSKIVVATLIVLLILLNLFQMYQYDNEMIHYDGMTKKAYLLSFVQETDPSLEWYEAVEDPDYDRAQMGLSESISEAEIDTLSENKRVSFLGGNLRFVTAEISGSTELTSSRTTLEAWEKFTLIHLGESKVALKAANGKFVCADKDQGWILIANRDAVGAWETFEISYLGNNRIALKADNKKYVSVQVDSPNRLVANADQITKREQFRIYIKSK
jgi:hypothetical protein